MKLKQGFFTTEYQGKQLLLASGEAVKYFRGIARSNETAAFIVDCLKQDTTEEKIVSLLLETYEVSREIAVRDVRAITGKLREIGALE